jgi:Nitroreductase family
MLCRKDSEVRPVLRQRSQTRSSPVPALSAPPGAGEQRAPKTPQPIRLPPPSLASGKAFADALRLRRTTREMNGRKIGAQLLSDLLFAACGVNRRFGPFGTPGITAASASNSQEVDLYVALEEGAYFFDKHRHALVPVVGEDIRMRAFGPHQPPVSPDAPVQLIFVVDLDKLEHTVGFEEPGLHDPEVQKSYYFVDTGLIAGNVYLFAASRGLACWFHHCDKAALARKLKLRRDQRVLFAQTVGHPSKPIR